MEKAAKFAPGQYVYTDRDIRGWFDHSVKDMIPANSHGVIVAMELTEPEPTYEVYFNKEFGYFHVKESDLKLG
jgi:hypothetical protein